MDEKFMRDLVAYQKDDTEFEVVPSKKRATGLFAITIILSITFGLIVFTASGMTPLRFALLKLFIPLIFILFIITFYVMVCATNKRYWFTSDAVRILTLYPKSKEDYLPLSEIAGINIRGLRLTGLPTRLITGDTVNHLTIELLDGKRYELNDMPHGKIVMRTLLDNVSAIRGVPWQKLVGLSHQRKALEEKLREEQKKGR